MARTNKCVIQVETKNGRNYFFGTHVIENSGAL
jgi:hypothetical protein